MSRMHDLKIWPPYFDDVLSGTKSFEVRKNDRKYVVEDVLRLREWDPKIENYTGREVFRRVTYMVHGMGQVGVVGPLRGLSTGYVILALSSEDINWPVVNAALRRINEDTPDGVRGSQAEGA